MFNENRRYKCLPLNFPFDEGRDMWVECVDDKKRILPFFNRNGYYYDRKLKRAWLEINGEAWLYGDFKAFEYDLKTRGNNRMEPHVFAAIGVLIKARRVSREQKEAYWLEQDLCMLAETYKGSQLAAHKSLKEWKEKLKVVKPGVECVIIQDENVR